MLTDAMGNPFSFSEGVIKRSISKASDEMSNQEFISKNENGKYVLIVVQQGQMFPTNGIAIPNGTNAVTKHIITGEVTFWRNSLESYFGSSVTNGSWQVNAEYQNGDDIEILWEREGFVYPELGGLDPEPPVDNGPVGPDLNTALEFADNEFIYLLEGLTHKRLSGIQKRIIKNILNNQ